MLLHASVDVRSSIAVTSSRHTAALRHAAAHRGCRQHAHRAHVSAHIVASASGTGQGNKRVLVLGGTGFVGSHICQVLLQEGYDVVSISRRGTPVSDLGW